MASDVVGQSDTAARCRPGASSHIAPPSGRSVTGGTTCAISSRCRDPATATVHRLRASRIVRSSMSLAHTCVAWACPNQLSSSSVENVPKVALSRGEVSRTRRRTGPVTNHCVRCRRDSCTTVSGKCALWKGQKDDLSTYWLCRTCGTRPAVDPKVGDASVIEQPLAQFRFFRVLDRSSCEIPRRAFQPDLSALAHDFTEPHLLVAAPTPICQPWRPSAAR